MNKSQSSWEHPETPADLETAVANLEGQCIARVDRIYGGALSLHIGDIVAGRQRDRGRWIATSWGGDWIVEGSQGIVDSRKSEDREVQAALARTVGDRIVKSFVDAGTRDLTLILDSGVILHLVVDRAYDGDAWTLSLPTKATISVHSTGECSIQSDKSHHE